MNAVSAREPNGGPCLTDEGRDLLPKNVYPGISRATDLPFARRSSSSTPHGISQASHSSLGARNRAPCRIIQTKSRVSSCRPLVEARPGAA